MDERRKGTDEKAQTKMQWCGWALRAAVKCFVLKDGPFANFIFKTWDSQFAGRPKASGPILLFFLTPLKILLPEINHIWSIQLFMNLTRFFVINFCHEMCNF